MHPRFSGKTAILLSLLLGVVALFSIMWILYLKLHTQNASLIADIYQDGVLLQSIRLDEVTESYTFIIRGSGGRTNEISVRPGYIGILSANCPDKLCVKQGYIHSPLLPITCLPNHLVIQIREETDTAPDVLTY